MAHRIEQHNDGELVYVAVDLTGIAHRADFVHPLIVVDLDEDNRPIGFSASGPAIDVALTIYRDWRREAPTDLSQLVARLKRAELATNDQGDSIHAH